VNSRGTLIAGNATCGQARLHRDREAGTWRVGVRTWTRKSRKVAFSKEHGRDVSCGFRALDAHAMRSCFGVGLTSDGWEDG
jgi:hypothetical protein